MQNQNPIETCDTSVLSNLTEGILLVTLNRPERLNATTPEMVHLYMQTLLDAAENDAVRVIVVTGAGRGFCSGADSTVLGALAGGGARASKLRRHWFTTQIPKPVIAAINGPCIGLGFVIAMMCDMRIAGQSATIGMPFARLGLPAENGIDWMLARGVGYSRAFEVLATGEAFAGGELLRLGLVNRLAPDEAVVQAALKLASSMAAHCSPRSLAMIKAQLNRCAHTDLPDVDLLADRLMSMSFGSRDFQEAISSRRERRMPVFEPLGALNTWWPGEESASELHTRATTT